MENRGNRNKKHSLWYTAALLAPVVHTASSQPWLPVLAMGSAAVILGSFSRWGTGWTVTVQRIWAAIMAGVILRWSSFYWRGLPIGDLTPLIILALVVWTVNAKGKAARIACVLLWPLMILLGAVLLSGISEIRMTNLDPVLGRPDLTLLAVLIIPASSGRVKRWQHILAALTVSVITVGVLSIQVTQSVDSGIYELSRSLSLLGVAERFESLIAAAMTLGFYASTALLLENQKGNVPWPAGITALTYLLGVEMEGWILVLGAVISWIILPLLELKKTAKKEKKGIDKM